MQVIHPSRWGQSVLQRGSNLMKSRQSPIVTTVGGHILQWVGEQPDSAPFWPAASTRSARIVKATISADRVPAKTVKRKAQRQGVTALSPLTPRPAARTATKSSASTQMANSFTPPPRSSAPNVGVDLSNLIQEMDRAMAVKWRRDHYEDGEIL
jgi:hypothetical protein